MPNMSLKKNEMPAQPADVRNGNFDEVALGYTEEQALDEAARCLHCKNKPCREGCPVGIDIPAFIARVAEKDYEGAYQVIAESSSLPAVCGRVCPQETQCEKHCVRAIKGESVGIGRLERFVADYHNTHSKAEAVRPASNGASKPTFSHSRSPTTHFWLLIQVCRLTRFPHRRQKFPREKLVLLHSLLTLLLTLLTRRLTMHSIKSMVGC